MKNLIIGAAMVLLASCALGPEGARGPSTMPSEEVVQAKIHGLGMWDPAISSQEEVPETWLMERREELVPQLIGGLGDPVSSEQALPTPYAAQNAAGAACGRPRAQGITRSRRRRRCAMA